MSLLLAQQALATPLETVSGSVPNRDDTGDAKLDFQGLCTKYGFEFETHTVTTEDGYILT